MTRVRRQAVLAWLGLALILAGCQSLGNLGREYDPRERPEQKAYEQDLAPYLARGTVHQGPATELMVTVLPLTPAVRRAMADREAAARGWDQARARARLAELDAEAAAGLEVMVCLYAPEKARADLLAARPDWTLALTGADGKTVGPGDVRLVKDRDALREALYPFWGPWDRLHRLRFPGLTPGQSQATLTVSGAPGRTELRLKLD
jgi:hypothetical protein